MKAKIIVFVLSIVFVYHSAYSQKNLSRFYKKANRFFKAYVKNGEVNYLGIKASYSDINELLTLISEANLEGISASKKKSFYINAYNILLINNVVVNYPVPYPLEQEGFFSSIDHPIAGDTLSLNEIEKKKLIDEHKDVRILFVLSSASRGSVVVSNFAYRPKKLNKQLKRKVKETVKDYKFVRVMSRSSKVLLVENLKRAQTDFHPQEIINLLNEYLEDPIPAGYTIDFYPANRKLNNIN